MVISPRKARSVTRAHWLARPRGPYCRATAPDSYEDCGKLCRHCSRSCSGTCSRHISHYLGTQTHTYSLTYLHVYRHTYPHITSHNHTHPHYMWRYVVERVETTYIFVFTISHVFQCAPYMVSYELRKHLIHLLYKDKSFLLVKIVRDLT